MSTPRNILVVGRAKTGTSIISKTIQASIPGSASYHLEPKQEAFFRQPDQPMPRVVKIIFEHFDEQDGLRLRIARNQMPMTFRKVVRIIRDPRDELVSRLLYIARPSRATLGPAERESWLEAWRRKEEAPGAISWHALGEVWQRLTGSGNPVRGCGRWLAARLEAELAFAKALGDRELLIRYEDFIDGRLDVLESGLGFPLRRDADAGEMSFLRRSGGYGGWREALTSEDVALIRPDLDPYLEALGYPSEWDLKKTDKLDPEHYSVYVKRILDQPPLAMTTTPIPAAPDEGPIFENQGIFALREAPCPDHATILVLGAARGGTSLAAGVLHHLGLFMGDLSRPPVFEDVRLAGALEGAGKSDPATVISDYDRLHPRWGFKRPDTLARSLGELLAKFRNPRLVLVCKDLAAIADRRRISSLVGDRLASMRAAWRDYGNLLDAIAACDVPVLVMSTDKCIAHREAAVDALAHFAGLSPDPRQRASAIGFISDRPTEYLEKARVGATRVAAPASRPSAGGASGGSPDFLCIGSQRAGTTWLARSLKATPGVALPNPTALHWLDANWGKGEAWYRQCFSGLSGLRGEVSPSYAVAAQDRISALAKICPSARILLVVRHPIRRAWSAIAAHLARKHPGPWRPELLAPALALARSRDMSSRSDYAAIAQAWSREFPAFSVLFYEDLCVDSALFLDQAMARLGIPVQVDAAPQPCLVPNPNAGPGWSMPTEVEALLHDRLGEKRLSFEKWLGRPIPAWDD